MTAKQHSAAPHAISLPFSLQLVSAITYTNQQKKIKILHTAFLYCTGLRSSNITCKSVLNQIFDTAYCILNDQYTNNSIFCGSDDQVQTKKKLEVQIKKKTVCIGFNFFSLS